MTKEDLVDEILIFMYKNNCDVSDDYHNLSDFNSDLIFTLENEPHVLEALGIEWWESSIKDVLYDVAWKNNMSKRYYYRHVLLEHDDRRRYSIWYLTSRGVEYVQKLIAERAKSSTSN